MLASIKENKVKAVEKMFNYCPSPGVDLQRFLTIQKVLTLLRSLPHSAPLWLMQPLML